MGRLFVVGLGPGDARLMTGQAREALEASEVIVGYDAYVAMIRDRYPEKDFLASGMRRELERCETALAMAARGRVTALVCSGDAGIYGMASPVLERAAAYPEVEIEVVPGVTAALYGAAVLGAPLGHDCCLISLSDLLTPWEVIERRLRAAVAGDFAIALYNPASRHRPDHLRRAVDILVDTGASLETRCGIVREGAREGERATLLTLAELRDAEVDMASTVFVGASSTVIVGGRLVTPRGYGRR